ncbi:MAG TPA: DUF6456 domain-containing protein [Stellaceae bacterium]|nr:DUF6456 domain-containing protein [Stellaceae bacterium]
MKSRARARRAPDTPAADHGPAERAQHGELVTRETMIAGVTGKRVKHECRLDWYWDKCSILDRQHAAGIRFRREWQLATAAPKVIGRYGARVTGRYEFTETQLAARRRLARVMTMLGQDLASVLIDVCCYDNWAGERLPKLRDGLTWLADDYGLPRLAGTKP